jgi:hypothetical protein
MPTVFLFDPISFGGTNNVRGVTDALQLMGVQSHIIPRELLDKRQIQSGQEGVWEWKVSGTGKAIPVHIPIADWRRLE